MLMNALSDSSTIHVLRGDYADAKALADELVALGDEKSAFPSKTFGRAIQGSLLSLTGNPSHAIEMITTANEELRSSGSTIGMPSRLAILGNAYAALRQFDDAWRCIDEAIPAIETTQERWSEAEILRRAGEVALISPQHDARNAEAYFERALSVASAQQAKSWELRAAMSMARLWRDQGKRQQAYDLLAPVYGWFTEGFDTLDLKQAKELLAQLQQ
jgi:tetratricopeptide (TPR) repeat protein